MEVNEFNITLPTGIHISRSLCPTDLEGVAGCKIRDMGNDYVWHTLPVSEIAGSLAIFDCCFQQGRLHTVSVCVVDQELYGSNWNEMTQEKEERRARDTKALLKQLEYQVGVYAWGKIWCGYDPKGGQGGAVIRFNTSHVAK